jgi:predicted Rossmann fold flavoprotein
MPKSFDIAIVGGGAAGLVAAISAARRGDSVVICERMPRLGKKILVTGGGRCNLTNDELGPEAFTSGSREIVASILGRFGKEDIRNFFRGLGLETYTEGGRVFPATNQASSVLKVLELELERLGISVELGFEASGIGHAGASFSVETADARRVEARSVVLAGGGRSYPALGSNGSAYALAGRFGHRLVTPVPSAVPVLAKDRMCHFLQGQKVRAAAIAFVGGKPAGRAEGEVLFTQYGLSGTAVLDISESLSIALHRDGLADTTIVLDLVPFLSEEALASEFQKRLEAGWATGDLAAGILPDKFAPVISAMAAGSERDPGGAGRTLAASLKAKRFAVLGTRGWNEAEFTSGGVDAREVDPRTLESKLRPGLFLAGEMLDVQGGRGGYNLAWAWASGHVAGLAGRQ